MVRIIIPIFCGVKFGLQALYSHIYCILFYYSTILESINSFQYFRYCHGDLVSDMRKSEPRSLGKQKRAPPPPPPRRRRTLCTLDWTVSIECFSLLYPLPPLQQSTLSVEALGLGPCEVEKKSLPCKWHLKSALNKYLLRGFIFHTSVTLFPLLRLLPHAFV